MWRFHEGQAGWWEWRPRPLLRGGRRAVPPRSLPWAAGSLCWGLITKTLTQEPEPLSARRPDLPAALSALVMQMVTRDLAVRFASTSDVLDALERME